METGTTRYRLQGVFELVILERALLCSLLNRFFLPCLPAGGRLPCLSRIGVYTTKRCHFGGVGHVEELCLSDPERFSMKKMDVPIS